MKNVNLPDENYTDSLFPEMELNLSAENSQESLNSDPDFQIPAVKNLKQKYVIQPNNITKAIYDMNLGSKRIIMLACSLLLTRDENGLLTAKKDLTVKFQLEDVMKSLQLSHGSTTKKMLEQGIETIFDQKLRIKTENGWTKMYHWFVSSNYSIEKNGIELTFTPEVAKAFVEYLNGYSVINLDVYGSLTGKYTIRMYELCWSYHGFASRSKEGIWSTPAISVEEIRTMWQIENEKYPMMSDFKKRVFEVARKEINSYENSQFTVEEIIDIKQGKKIIGFQFVCKLREVKNDPLLSLGEKSKQSDEEILHEHNNEIIEEFKKILKFNNLEGDPNRIQKENQIFEDVKEQILNKYK